MASSTFVICSSLTDDILIEIFTYLPLNSVYKLKSLLKVWLSNLSNPNFITKWFHLNNKSLPWILYYSIIDRRVAGENPFKLKSAHHDLHSEIMSRNEHLFSFKFLTNKKPFQGSKLLLLDSSNGLVLCSSFTSDNQRMYHVCNPLTQRWVSLPLPPRSEIRQLDFGCIFCEYSSSSFASCYKVVCIPQFDEPSKKFDVDIFCSDLGVWKSFQVSCDENVVRGWYDFDKIVILNGILFRMEGGHRLLVYDLNQKNKSDEHRCSLISLPDMEFDNAECTTYRSRIGESEGCLCYAKTRITLTEMVVSVWVLNDVNWKILHKDISIDGIFAEVRSRVGEEEAELTQVLGFNPLDRNTVFLGCKNWVWMFDIQTRSFEELCLDNRHVDKACMMFLPFVLMPMPTVLPLPSWADNLE